MTMFGMGARLLRLRPQVPSEPGEVALDAVALVAGPGEAVMLTRIDDELGLSPEAPERLVHVLRVDERHVEILLPAHAQRRGGNGAGLEERVRRAEVAVDPLPGQAQLVLVLADVLVGAVAGDLVRDAGAAGSGLEASGAGDRVVRHHAAVAPAEDAEALGIGDTPGHEGVHGCQHVLHLPVPPIAEYRAREFETAPGAAAVVRLDHDVASPREGLRPDVEFVLVLSGGTTVDI